MSNINCKVTKYYCLHRNVKVVHIWCAELATYWWSSAVLFISSFLLQEKLSVNRVDVIDPIREIRFFTGEKVGLSSQFNVIMQRKKAAVSHYTTPCTATGFSQEH